ncbi:hypothetical protein CMESO_478 (nucleomorph) [Chroomonas mesostigmatica CCMP1168]|uniref:Uncharacterized protein n=1 Tax=Chroomonas mesostigmatica CCMP1168 TaxID=1195612 RepID=J7G8Q5_9CRYP|nr:hypothetical protein CMESO_478 [Chroomonas mesostigmatica CCMP1168]
MFGNMFYEEIKFLNFTKKKGKNYQTISIISFRKIKFLNYLIRLLSNEIQIFFFEQNFSELNTKKQDFLKIGEILEFLLIKFEPIFLKYITHESSVFWLWNENIFFIKLLVKFFELFRRFNFSRQKKNIESAHEFDQYQDFKTKIFKNNYHQKGRKLFANFKIKNLQGKKRDLFLEEIQFIDKILEKDIVRLNKILESRTISQLHQIEQIYDQSITNSEVLDKIKSKIKIRKKKRALSKIKKGILVTGCAFLIFIKIIK